MKSKFGVRWLLKRDMKEVLDIELDCFQVAWTEEDFLCCLRQRNCIGMIAEDNKHRLCGYMIYELHEASLRILNFAVKPHYWRMGVGTAMVERLKAKLQQQRRTDITLEIRERNLAGQLFFSSQGFFAERVLRNHYDDTAEDAYFMRYTVREEPVFWGGRLSAYGSGAVSDQYPVIE